MSSQDRRAAGLRRAWGRGPIILKLERLERRAIAGRQRECQLGVARPGEFLAGRVDLRLGLGPDDRG